jgi:site-specific DNA-methyltransferase (adenine-specific)/modification methylase
MSPIGRPYTYHADRPATTVERVRAHRLKHKTPRLPHGAASELPAVSTTSLDTSLVPCRQIGSRCVVYCSDWQTVYPCSPRQAAIVTDPPYPSHYDVTKTRRRASQWARNFVGADQPFDPTPWFGFPEVILFGADQYWHPSMQQGSWWRWDKMPGQQPADFAPAEWSWLSMPGPPHDYPHLWRGGMRAGEENYSRLPQKLHPAQKPIDLLTDLVQQTTAPVVLDPFMGSGTTLAACVRLRRPCIGIEIDEHYFAVACARLQQEVEALGLFA